MSVDFGIVGVSMRINAKDMGEIPVLTRPSSAGFGVQGMPRHARAGRRGSVPSHILPAKYSKKRRGSVAGRPSQARSRKKASVTGIYKHVEVNGHPAGQTNNSKSRKRSGSVPFSESAAAAAAAARFHNANQESAAAGLSAEDLYRDEARPKSVRFRTGKELQNVKQYYTDHTEHQSDTEEEHQEDSLYSYDQLHEQLASDTEAARLMDMQLNAYQRDGQQRQPHQQQQQRNYDLSELGGGGDNSAAFGGWAATDSQSMFFQEHGPRLSAHPPAPRRGGNAYNQISPTSSDNQQFHDFHQFVHQNNNRQGAHRRVNTNNNNNNNNNNGTNAHGTAGDKQENLHFSRSKHVHKKKAWAQNSRIGDRFSRAWGGGLLPDNMKGIQRAKNVLMPSNAFYRKQRQIANKQVDLHEIFKNARIEALQASKQSRKDKAEKAQQAKKGKALARRQRDLRRKQRQQKRSVKLNNENRAPPSWRTEQDDLMFNSKGEPLMVPSFPFPPKSFLEQKPEQGSPSKAQLRRLATLKFSKPIYTAPMTM